MTFEAKTLVPLPCDPDAAHAIFEDAASGGITLLEVPTGYALTEGLALAFSDLDRRPLWLRLGPEDSDPATFLLSLVTAARRQHRDAGQATLALMKEQPGPVFGWPPLYTQLARDLRVCLAPGGALVLEDIHHAADGSPALSWPAGTSYRNSQAPGRASLCRSASYKQRTWANAGDAPPASCGCPPPLSAGRSRSGPRN